MKAAEFAVRLDALLAHYGEDRCWIWPLSKKTGGYGQVSIDEQPGLLAHRESYKMLVGPIPDEACIDHVCLTRACVNPRHLRLLSRVSNVMIGDGAPARNRRKTHCPKGHSYEGDNLLTDPKTGYRQCRACNHARYLARKAGPRGSHFGTRTHCPSGHAYTPENTKRDKHGHRRCKACKKAISLRDTLKHS